MPPARKTADPAELPEIPLLTADVDYAVALIRLRELKDLERTTAAVLDNAQEERRKIRRATVKALIRGDELPTMPDAAEAQAAERLGLIRLAIPEVEEEIRQARDAAGRRASDLARPAHKAAALGVAEALFKLVLALEAEEAIRAKLGQAGHLPLLPFLGFAPVGAHAAVDSSSAAQYWYANAANVLGPEWWAQCKPGHLMVERLRAAQAAAGKVLAQAEVDRLADLRRQAQTDPRAKRALERLEDEDERRRVAHEMAGRSQDRSRQ